MSLQTYLHHEGQFVPEEQIHRQVSVRTVVAAKMCGGQLLDTLVLCVKESLGVRLVYEEGV